MNSMNVSVITSKISLIDPKKLGFQLDKLRHNEIYDRDVYPHSVEDMAELEARLLLGRMLDEVDGYYDPNLINGRDSKVIDMFACYAGIASPDDVGRSILNCNIFYRRPLRMATSIAREADSSEYVYVMIRITGDKEYHHVFLLVEPRK